MLEFKDYKPSSIDPTSRFTVSPSEDSGWSSRTVDDEVHWHTSDADDYATMRDIHAAGWTDKSIKLSAFDEAGYSWRRFSRMVEFFGAARFGDLLNQITEDAMKHPDLIGGASSESRHRKATARLAGEIDDRLYTIGYYGIPDDRVDNLLVISLVLAPALGAPFDWNSALSLYSHFGVEDAALLQGEGFTVKTLIEAARSGVDAGELIALSEQDNTL